MLVTKQLLVATDFHRMGNKYYKINGYHQLFGYTNMLENIFFCVSLGSVKSIYGLTLITTIKIKKINYEVVQLR